MRKSILTLALAASCMLSYAQDLIIPKQGDPIKVWNIEQSDKYIFYTSSPESTSQISRMAKDDVLMIRRADGVAESVSVSTEAPATPTREELQDSPEIKEEDIHGSLIAEGNCVFIPTDSPLEYEKAGQVHLKEYIKKWGRWKVVSKPEQAHFILQFTTQVSGEDFSFLIIRPRRYYAAHPTLVREGFLGSWTTAKGEVGIIANCVKSNEEVGENALKAEWMAEHLKKMITEPDSKDGKKFYKYHGKALDADNPKNNSTSMLIGVR